MDAKVFILRMITNLHMGSGETTLNFIDKQVQRDPITTYPNMHASGIKGALREFFRRKENNMESNFIKTIFGEENNSSSILQGALTFTEGRLLALPVRSNRKSYFLGTTKEILKEYIEFMKILGKEVSLDIDKFQIPQGKKILVADTYEEELIIEGIESIDMKVETELMAELKKVIGIEDVVIFTEEFFKEEISKKLPVLARNYLENGVSRNLWYEEIIPRETLFYMGILNSQRKNEEFKIFTEELTKNLIQIGANATIGYGFTKFKEVKNDDK